MTETLAPWDEGKRRIVTPEEALQRLEKYRDVKEPPKVPEKSNVPVAGLDDFVRLYDVKCIGSGGKAFEEYPILDVSTGLVTILDATGKPTQKMRAFDAIVAAEKSGLFIPSLALYCNIIAKLSESNEEAQKRLFERIKKEAEEVTNLHTNTIVDVICGRIVHYDKPRGPSIGPAPAIYNNSRGTVFRNFNVKTIFGKPNRYAAGISPDDRRLQGFIKDLTGLEKPKTWIQTCDKLGVIPNVLVFPIGKDRDQALAATMFCGGLTGGGMNYSIMVSRDYGILEGYSRGVRE